MHHEQLNTVEETMSKLRVGRTKLYDLIKRGRIHPVKIDSATRFSNAEIERFIADAMEAA